MSFLNSTYNYSIIDVDPAFKEEIMAAVSALQSAGKNITVNAVAEQMTLFIVNCYNKVSFFVYKADWIKRIINTLKLTGTEFTRSKVSFEKHFCYIQDRVLGIKNNLDSNDLPSMTSFKSTIPSSSSNSTVTISSSNSSKQLKLDEIDKEKIKELYQSLNEQKMWKLKTGKTVEKEMERFALNCNYEHPCHSLIFDSADKCWNNYFTKEELTEIKTYRLKDFPQLPFELIKYLETLSDYTSLDLDTLHKNISAIYLHPAKDSAKEWAQSSIINTIKLFMCHYIPITDHSESDIIRRIWLLLDNVFDYSTIVSRSGEKSSSASSDSRNQTRTIASVEPMTRKFCGRKVDMVFKSDSTELGCMECGRSDGINTTKEMADSLIKLPKVLKDMFISLCNSAPTLVNDLSIPGVVIMNTKFTLITMDSPSGYICRLSRVAPVSFPTRPTQIINMMVPILNQIYSARLLMERNLNLIDDCPVGVQRISFQTEDEEKCNLVAFVEANPSGESFFDKSKDSLFYLLNNAEICVLKDEVINPYRYMNEKFELNFRDFYDGNSLSSINSIDPQCMKRVEKS